ncbi:MAG TPA: phosphoribosylanthranilate isomerase, partial [Candidatus Angelobacter sp.]|nr:phosphoribosylanthranilate isomerase [Candidatus Angelobacter sp.]
MTTLVKICGITRAQDARLAEKLGAWALGFNFYEKSPRAVAPADAWKIRRKLAPTTQAVGVFVNWKPEVIMYLVHALQLTSVQLHGDETPKHLNYLEDDLPVIKAFRAGPGFSMSNFKRFRRTSYFLLDSAAKKDQFGGTGKTFDWSIAQRAAAKHKIILAGGLTPENVGEAILTVRPYAVDVASGVESRPGVKDSAKLRDFFAEVARANRA